MPLRLAKDTSQPADSRRLPLRTTCPTRFQVGSPRDQHNGAKAAGRREQEALMSFEIVERRIEIRAGAGIGMRVESRDSALVIDIAAEPEG
jgi:hypothetical protein